jgi:hypothetical protein
MDSLHKELMSTFGQGDRPRERELVLWNGFDDLEKESALRRVAQRIAEKAAVPDVFAEFTDDIAAAANQFLAVSGGAPGSSRR